MDYVRTIATQWPLIIGLWASVNMLAALGLMAFGRPER